jgi:hypothetical protein
MMVLAEKHKQSIILAVMGLFGHERHRENERHGENAPGLEPDGETPVSENPSFVSACLSIASRDAAALGWRLGKSILTYSYVWGFVFRIDIQSKYQIQNSKLTHRFICWSAEEDDKVAGTALIPGYNHPAYCTPTHNQAAAAARFDNC